MMASPYDIIFSYGDTFGTTSVIIPLYNYAHTVADTLDAVKAQDIGGISLIIVDDKSTDDSLAVAGAWCAENFSAFSAVRLVSHIKNAGLSASRNTGTLIARSEFIFFLDADNTIYPRCIRRLQDALKNSDAAFAFSILEIFGQRTGIFGTRVFSSELLAKGPYIDAMALIRKSALEAAGGYKFMPHGWEDYELWLTFAEGGDHGIQVPEILGRYRTHQASMTRTRTMRNIKRVERRTRELHPWVDFPASSEFLPPIFQLTWSRLDRYGRMAVRAALRRLARPAHFKRLVGHLLANWHRYGLRAAAEELKLIDAVDRLDGGELRLPNRADRTRSVLEPPVEAKWLPRFSQAEQEERHAALMPFCLPTSPLSKDRRIGIFVYLSGAIEPQWLSGALGPLLERGKVHIALDEASDQQSVRLLMPDADIETASGVDNDKPGDRLVAAMSVFGDQLAAYDYVAFMHLGEAYDGQEEAQHRILFAPRNIESVLSAFETDSSIGLLDAATAGAEIDAPNEQVFRTVITHSSLRVDPSLVMARSLGSMFWARPSALTGLTQALKSVRGGHHGLGTTMLDLLYLACEDAGFNRLTVTDSQVEAQIAGFVVHAIKSFDDLSAVILRNG